MNIREKTYGVNFPFLSGDNNEFLSLTKIPEQEVKSNLVHLLLTRKGSRYYLPDFGTNLYQYIFEPLDEITLTKIEDEINDAVEKYIPNLTINKIIITRLEDISPESYNYRHSIRINIEYTINSRTFQSSSSVTVLI